MNVSRTARALLALAFITLLGAWSVEAPRADLSIFWRAAVLSFDNPTTQSNDELATQVALFVDIGRQVRDQALGAFVVSGRVPLPFSPRQSDPPPLRARLSRSPPAA